MSTVLVKHLAQRKGFMKKRFKFRHSNLTNTVAVAILRSELAYESIEDALQETSTVYVLLCKHAYGPYKNKWGIASSSELTDRRSQRRAARLVEFTTLGLEGTLDDMESRCRYYTKTPVKNILSYTLFTKNSSLDEQINGVSRYIHSCYAEGDNGNLTLPEYMLPWDLTKWVLLDRATLDSMKLDPYSTEALDYILIKRTATNGQKWVPEEEPSDIEMDA